MFEERLTGDLFECGFAGTYAVFDLLRTKRTAERWIQKRTVQIPHGARNIGSEELRQSRLCKHTRFDFMEHSLTGQRAQDAVKGGSVRSGQTREFVTGLRTTSE